MKSAPRRLCLVVVIFVGLVVPRSAQAQFNFGGSSAKKIAHIHLHGPITEKPVDPMGTIFATQQPMSVKDLIERFKKARDDDSVKAVVVTIEDLSAGLAQLEELRGAIRQIRAADKDVFIHADVLSNTQYILAASASHLSMVPTGDIWLTGLHAEQPYLKGMLDKLHIEADFEQMGDFKSAAEALTKESPSEQAAENMNWLLDGLYDAMVSMIAEDRQVTADRVKTIIDKGPYSAERALDAGLIDSIKYRQDFFADLKDRYGDVDFVKGYGRDTGPEVPTDPFALLGFFSELFQGATTMATTPSVAVIYVEGAITEGSDQPNPFGGSSGAKSSSIRKALNIAASDPSVKAVVLRVDSPGGSALASEIIWNATQRVAAKKPLIVSMGNIAASGGYYVSCGADTIFADEGTITASIGVVGGKLVTTKGWNCLGVNWVEYKRGAHSGIMSTSNKFTDSERSTIVGWMNDIYKVFKARIEAGRGDRLTKPLDQMAGGRVYSGKQALELGLIDRIGGMSDALKYAAAQANIGDYEIRVIPKPKNIFELLMEGFGGPTDDEGDYARASLVQTFTGSESPWIKGVLPILGTVDPMRVQAMIRMLQRIEILQRENVLLAMPNEIIIR